MQLRVLEQGFLAPLVGITMVREMGPLLTAIILAGRAGSATTADRNNGSWGRDRCSSDNELTRYNSLCTKILGYIDHHADTFYLGYSGRHSGGYFVALLYLDLSSSLFVRLGKSLAMKDVFAGFIKSVVFSWLIIWIGSFYGFKVRGGAEAVGKETTASVVTGIFIIIIADALFSFIL